MALGHNLCRGASFASLSKNSLLSCISGLYLLKENLSVTGGNHRRSQASPLPAGLKSFISSARYSALRELLCLAPLQSPRGTKALWPRNLRASLSQGKSESPWFPIGTVTPVKDATEQTSVWEQTRTGGTRVRKAPKRSKWLMWTQLKQCTKGCFLKILLLKNLKIQNLVCRFSLDRCSLERNKQAHRLMALINQGHVRASCGPWGRHGPSFLHPKETQLRGTTPLTLKECLPQVTDTRIQTISNNEQRHQ